MIARTRPQLVVENRNVKIMTNSIVIFFIEFPINGLGDPNIYQKLESLTRMWDFTWRVSDCEELVG